MIGIPFYLQHLGVLLIVIYFNWVLCSIHSVVITLIYTSSKIVISNIGESSASSSFKITIMKIFIGDQFSMTKKWAELDGRTQCNWYIQITAHHSIRFNTIECNLKHIITSMSKKIKRIASCWNTVVLFYLRIFPGVMLYFDSK